MRDNIGSASRRSESLTGLNGGIFAGDWVFIVVQFVLEIVPALRSLVDMDKATEKALIDELMRLRARCDVSISMLAVLMAQMPGVSREKALAKLQSEIDLRVEHYQKANQQGGGSLSASLN